MASLDCEVIMTKKLILEFALKNWKTITIVFLCLALALKSRYDYHLMQKAYQIQSDSVQAQIDGLKEIHKQEIQKKQLLMESHLESIAVIEQEYEDARKELEELKLNKTKEYTRKYRDDKHQLIKDIENKFGVEYVP